MADYAPEDVELFVEILKQERIACRLNDPELVFFVSPGGYNCFFQIDASGKKVGTYSIVFMGHDHPDVYRVVDFLMTLEKGDLSPLIAAARSQGVKVRLGAMDEVAALGLG